MCLYFLLISHSEMGPCQAVQAGLVQPGEDFGGPIGSFAILKESIEKMEPSSLQELIAGVML